mmetsp:Transcript_9096/g.13705  ORF Transcript_9096/g.13705 Transcript_9096/m.13705 type:complete len:297 (+) Transcript_9096:27-917(+)
MMMEEEGGDNASSNSCPATDSAMATPTDDFEALLSVPIEIIFREIMQTQIISGGKRTNQRTFLFSKSEVTTLLRVSLLASELTTTIAMVYEALDRARKGNMYRREIIEATHNNNGYLRALLPIIAIHSETAQDALTNVTSDTTFGISRILQELDDCAMELSKFSETNFNMADQLDWTMTDGQCSVLSKEKRAIAEIEEAVVARITCLKEMAIGGTTKDEEEVETTNNDVIDTTSSGDDAASNYNHRDDRFTPMRDLCHKIFKEKEKAEFNLNTSSSEHSQSQITAAEAMASLAKEG